MMNWIGYVSTSVGTAVITILGVLLILKKTGITDFIQHKAVSGDAKLEDTTKKELFERKYYKDVSIDVVITLLNDWLGLIMDFENCFVKRYQRQGQGRVNKELTRVLTNMIVYCSKETLSLMSHIMQLIYKNNDSSEESNLGEKEDGQYKYELMFAVAVLISNIKFDYSNDFVDPIGILKIKINDISKHREVYEKLEKDYSKFYRI